MADMLLGSFSSVIKMNLEILLKSIDKVFSRSINNKDLKRICSKVNVVKSISAFFEISEYTFVFKRLEQIVKSLINKDDLYQKNILLIIRQYVKNIDDLDVDGMIFKHIPDLEIFLKYPDSFLLYDEDPLNPLIIEEEIKVKRVDCIQNFLFLNTLENDLKRQSIDGLEKKLALLKDSFYISYFNDLKSIVDIMTRDRKNLFISLPEHRINMFKDKTPFFKNTIILLDKVFYNEEKINIKIKKSKESCYCLEVDISLKDKNIKEITRASDDLFSKMLNNDWKNLYFIMRNQMSDEVLKQELHSLLSLKNKIDSLSIDIKEDKIKLKLGFPQSFFLTEEFFIEGI